MVKLPQINDFHEPRVNDSSLRKFAKMKNTTAMVGFDGASSPASGKKNPLKQDYDSLKRTYARKVLLEKRNLRNVNNKT